MACSYDLDVDDLAGRFGDLAVVKSEVSAALGYAESSYETYTDNYSSRYSSSSYRTADNSPPRYPAPSQQSYANVSPPQYSKSSRYAERPSTSSFSVPINPGYTISAYQGTGDECNNCFEPTTPKVVLPSNPNGNAGRPYSICENIECPKTQPGKSSFVRWNDEILPIRSAMAVRSLVV